jgi:hypothetical protein
VCMNAVCVNTDVTLPRRLDETRYPNKDKVVTPTDGRACPELAQADLQVSLRGCNARWFVPQPPGLLTFR